MEVIWLLIFVVLLLFEVATLALTTIWFAGGAFVAFIATMLGATIEIQLVLFVIVSLLMLIFTRPVFVKHLNGRTVRTNADRLIGQRAVVTVTIDNLQAAGAVTVNGQEWTARSLVTDQVIEKETIVQIKNISGVKLIVAPLPKEEQL